MFSLIITIISIALVAALAVATIYYGGDAFNQGTSKAKASTVVNQAQQIAGAATLYKSNGGNLPTLASVGALSPSYLATVPASDSVTLGLDATEQALGKVKITGTLSAGSTEVCAKINDIANGTTTGAYVPGAQFGCNPTGLAFFFQG